MMSGRPSVRCSRRAPTGRTDEWRASGIAEAGYVNVDAKPLAAELGRQMSTES